MHSPRARQQHGPLLLLRGTLDLLILKALENGPLHGHDVSLWVRSATEGALGVGEGSLYPALHRLERRGLVSADWGRSRSNRKAKYHRLTSQGRRRLASETSQWHRYARAVATALSGESEVDQPGTPVRRRAVQGLARIA